jgi:hypothetical protein
MVISSWYENPQKGLYVVVSQDIIVRHDDFIPAECTFLPYKSLLLVLSDNLHQKQNVLTADGLGSLTNFQIHFCCKLYE